MTGRRHELGNLTDVGEILQLQLKLIYYPGPKLAADASMRSWIRSALEEGTQWDVKVWMTAAHMEEFVLKFQPDVLITHWHGDTISSDTPRKAIESWREKLKQSRSENVPFVVGEFGEYDVTHHNPLGQTERDRSYNGVFLDLGPLYDMLFTFYDEETIEMLSRNLAIGIWNTYVAKVEKSKFLPFDEEFEGYLSCALFDPAVELLRRRRILAALEKEKGIVTNVTNLSPNSKHEIRNSKQIQTIKI